MKTPKFALLTLLSLPLLGTEASAQFRLVTLLGQETVTLASNEVAEVTQALIPGSGFGFTIDGKNILTSTSQANGSSVTLAPSPVLVSGPRTIGVIDAAHTGAGLVSFRIYDRAMYQAGPAAGVPSSTVVIPTEPAGNTRVVLESSADLVTWTAAQPGTYGSVSTNRFFRLRVERAN